MTTAELTEAIEIFFSYAHTDEALRNELEKHLSVLKRQGYITYWHDRNISAGQEWRFVIDEHLNTARVILLLVSSDFMASDYCYSKEMLRAMERHERGEAHIIPIILRSVDWEDAPFGKLQALPANGRPISSSQWHDLDEAFLDVVQGIKKVVKELSSVTLQSPNAVPKSSKKISHSIWNVPFRRNPFFTGREEVLINLHKLLTAGQTAAITQPQALSGLGGIGKTQTAIEYAYRYHDEYQTVLWVKSETREMLELDLCRAAGLLNLPEKNAQDQNIVVNAVKRWLETHAGWLLIFDNADDLNIVRDYLPSGNKGHILLTTRTQTMSGLARKVELEKMELDEGALFLLRRAGILSPETMLDHAFATDRTKAIEITQEMDGLPLALDQAGAYIEETSCDLSDYLFLYHIRRTDLLQLRGGFASEHPDPVATTWSLSFEKVEQANPAAAELLRLCAFLAPDDIPIEIITEGAPCLGPILQSVAIDPLKWNIVIAETLKYSLLRRNRDTQTLTIHRLVQAVIKDQMNDSLQRQWAERVVRAVSTVFPEVEFANWSRCQRLLPHAQVCATLIQQWHIDLPEAALLLNQLGFYLRERAYYAEAQPLYTCALDIYERVLGHDHSDVAAVLNNLALLYGDQGKYEQAQPLYQRALAIYEKTVGREHYRVALSLNNLALLYREQGKYSLAESHCQSASEIFERTLGPEHPYTIISFNNLALFYRDQGKYAQAEVLYQRILAVREQTLGTESLDVAINLSNLARIYFDQGKYEQAEPLYQRVLKIYENILGQEHPYVATSLNNLGLLYREQGKYTQAEPLYQRALEIREQTLDPEHPYLAISLNNLALLYRDQGKHNLAKALYQRALAIYEKALGQEHPYVAISLNNLALFYYDQGEYALAESLYRHALTIFERTLGPEHPHVATNLNNLALLYNAQGQYTRAQPLHRRALTIRERTLGPEHPYVATSMNNLARVYYNQGKYTQAEQLYQEALAIRKQTLGPEHPHVAQSLADIAHIYYNQGKYAQAEPLYQEALKVYKKIFGQEHPYVLTALKNYNLLLQKMEEGNE